MITLLYINTAVNKMTVKRRIKTFFDKNNLLLIAEIKSVEQLQISAIEYILADNNFTKVFFSDDRSILVHKSLNEWESFLPEKIFIRINRGVIINLQHIRLIEKSAKQTLTIHMQHYNEPMIMSRGYVKKLQGTLTI